MKRRRIMYAVGLASIAVLAIAGFAYAAIANLTTVKTVDSEAQGFHMYMVDYEENTQKNIGGSYSENKGSITKDVYSKTIAEGNEYPTIVQGSGTVVGKNTSYLFGEGSGRTPANKLFLKSVYEDTGYYYYNAAETFAHFNTDGNFTVYNQLGSPSGGDNYYFKRGNFMPYNSLNKDRVINYNRYSDTGAALKPGDPRYDEEIYGFNEGNNYHFGMYGYADFPQPVGGQVKDKDGNTSDMIYEFTGDDDLVIYIDGVLVLDLGGIHDAQSGSINFATGEVRYTVTQTGQTPAWEATTIKAMFEDAGKDGDVAWEGNTFTAGTMHKFQMFYMERGAGASNLKMKFNIPPIPDGSVVVSKLVTGQNEAQSDTREYTMMLILNGEAAKGQKYTLNDGSTTEYTTKEDGTFILKKGQSATFSDIEAGTKVSVREITPEGEEFIYDISYTYKTSTGESGQSEDQLVPSSGNITATVKNAAKEDLVKNLTVNKTFEGTEGNAAPAGFEAVYQLWESSNDGIWKKIDTVSYDKFNSGSYTFGKLDATRNYKVVEVLNNTADTETAIYNHTDVSIEKPEASHLSKNGIRPGADHSISSSEAGNIVLKTDTSFDNTVTFNNAYCGPATTTLNAAKKLEGLDLADKQFTFQLLDAAGTVIEEAQNAADGTVEFTELKYETTGEFHYQIKEVLPEGVTADKPVKDGITYDTKVVDVTVTVTDDESGKLVAKAKYEPKAVFENKYDAEGSSGVKGQKVLVGKSLEGGEFEFTISGDGPLPENTTVKNKANGIVDFGEIKFTLENLGKAEAEPATAATEESTEAAAASESENKDAAEESTEATASENADSDQPATETAEDAKATEEQPKEKAAAPAAREKTFTYTVSESGSMPGVKNDSDKDKTFTITIRDDGDGGIIATTSPEGDNAFTFTNVYTPASATLGVTKAFVNSATGESAWDEYDNPEFEFTLAAVNGAPMPENDKVTADKDHQNPYFGSIEFDEVGTYEYKIRETPGQLDGVTYDTDEHTAVVTVEEADQSLNASVKYDGNKDTLTVTNTAERVNVSGTKTWDDKELIGKDGYQRPKSITVNLLANGEKVDSKTVTADDNWAYSFENLDKYSAGKEIKYTVEETAVPGYDPSYEGFDITNTPDDFGKLTVTKYIVNSQFQPLTGSGEYYVALFSDEGLTDRVSSVQTISFNKQKSSTVTFNVPKNVTYYVAETDADGKVLEGAGTTDDSPFLICFGDPSQIPDDQDWPYETAAKSGDNAELYNVYNDVPPPGFYTDGDVTVTKIVKDYKGDDKKVSEDFYVTVYTEDGSKLYITDPDAGKDHELAITRISLENASRGQGIIKDIPLGKYTLVETDKDGNPLENPKYIASFDKDPSFEVTDAEEADNSFAFTLTNKEPGTSVSGEKEWNDSAFEELKEKGYNRPASITVNLYADNGEKPVASQAVEADATGNWSYTFEPLPKNNEDGSEIVYTVKETPVDGYETEYDGNNIINTPKEGEKLIPVILNIEKTDANTGNGLAGAVFEITKEGEADASVTSETDADGKTSFEFRTDGTYTIKEKTAPSGYDLNKSGWKVVVDKGEITKVELIEKVWTKIYNLFFGEGTDKDILSDSTLTVPDTPEPTAVPVEKKWNDADNQDGKRPESITVNLTGKVGNEVVKTDSKTIEADASGNWSYTFEKLPAYRDGEKIEYTVSEEAITDYQLESLTGDAAKGYVFTNKHDPAKITLEGAKTWNDKELIGKDGYQRPKSITVNLLANGEKVDSKTVTADDNWAYSFENLDEYSAGEKIEYKVEETAVPGYEASYKGFNITNEPKDFGELTVTKHIVNSEFQPLTGSGEYYVALFSDEGLTDRVSSVQTISFNKQKSSKVTFKVPNGQTYYVAETDADGKVLEGAGTTGDSPFLICFGDPSQIPDDQDWPYVDSVETGGNSELYNVYYDVPPPGFFADGTVAITKLVKDSKGKALDVTEDFYVTVYTVDGKKLYINDPDAGKNNELAITKISIEKASKGKGIIKNIPLGKYKLVETDANGNPVKNSKYVASFDKTPTFEVTDQQSADNEFAFTLTNKAKDEGTGTKTGDSMNLTLVLIVMITSMMIGAVVLLMGRRKES